MHFLFQDEKMVLTRKSIGWAIKFVYKSNMAQKYKYRNYDHLPSPSSWSSGICIEIPSGSLGLDDRTRFAKKRKFYVKNANISLQRQSLLIFLVPNGTALVWGSLSCLSFWTKSVLYISFTKIWSGYYFSCHSI